VILDQPFIGLDVSGREMLNKILSQLSARGVNLLLITNPNEIPEYITHIAEIFEGRIRMAVPKKEYEAKSFLPSTNSAGPKIPPTDFRNEEEFEFAVKMVDVNIHYGDKPILQNIYWEVKKAERWSLSGPNGAGKSTLLSLITADNPQAYANEIYLFDRRRGSGESIWDIKRKIGYISPELHLYFDQSATSLQAIASGFFDTIGLFRQLNSDQYDLVIRWLQFFQLEGKKHRMLSQLSLGEQRFVLLARALIKNPPLLILDEACQGLDQGQTYFFKSVVNEFCLLRNSTLIYVSHYEHEIPACVDRHFKITHGKRV